ncbi:hypothetical protein VIGAN_10156700 [Vigna angularis var. angularis]|uniref:CASP-like protein n=1 Tax=Vigna angularis var. angularis TaxID=157739 RepID=A0A0S3T518_PHAAN|nr:hypothetical protein VIGAN_10156700 [Vigna angularis var. angularis]
MRLGGEERWKKKARDEIEKVEDREFGKPALLRNVLTQLLIIGLLIVTVRFAYVITLAGESCTLDDFWFFSSEVRSASVAATALEHYASKDWINNVRFYLSMFQEIRKSIPSLRTPRSSITATFMAAPFEATTHSHSEPGP